MSTFQSDDTHLKLVKIRERASSAGTVSSNNSSSSSASVDLETSSPESSVVIDLQDDTSASSEEDGDVEDAVAIIGFSLTFPGDITTPEKFWELILNARSTLSEVPKDRWNTEGFYSADPNKVAVHKTRKLHFVKQDVSVFDAQFFSITAAEAECMDPQQRWLLESAFHAFENAGLTLDQISNSRTSVFIGSFLQDYGLLMAKDPQIRAAHQATGNGRALQANRLSWFFNLKGPSLALDTACSGSMIALHLACQSIRTGETDMGIIGGCNLMLSPDTISQLSDSGFLSPDGQSYSFDHRVNGYSRGEGAGMIVVKRLSHAIRDGDTIRAIVRATASNQDGKTPGITQPDTDAQRSLIEETYRVGRISMAKTEYFEAHGTGTGVGDPIEARAIAEAFRRSDQNRPIHVTSVKPNIGHLENVSGVASIIKTVLILENGIIPPCGNFEKQNPAIKDDWGLRFPLAATPWPTQGLRRASVNSFGYGGANCHVVLDDACYYARQRGIAMKHRTKPLNPPTKVSAAKQDEQDLPRLLIFSTADEGGIKRLSEAYQEHLSKIQPQDKVGYLANLAFTLGSKRTRLPWRSCVALNSGDALFDEGSLSKFIKPYRASSPIKSLFVFTGQGAQWPRMGHELSIYPVFRKSLQALEIDIQNLGCKWSLWEELAEAKESSRINEPDLSQPMCTAVQIALVDLLRHWNIEASAVVGHSSGEIAAAYCAGAISRQSAIKLAYFRGLVSDIARKMCRGTAGMMAVGISREAIEERLSIKYGASNGGIYVACVNSSKSVTLSGPNEELESLREDLQEEEVFARFLKTGVPYHSPYMESVAPVYEALIQKLEPGDLETDAVHTFSSTTGVEVTTETLLSPAYWVKNLVSTVQFFEAMSAIFPDNKNDTDTERLTQERKSFGINFVLEVGPHPALKGPVSDVLRAGRYERKVAYTSTLQRDKNSITSLLDTAGQLFTHGSSVDLLSVNNLDDVKDTLQKIDDLPLYPFNHSKGYWIEGRISKNYRLRENNLHSLLGLLDPTSSPYEFRWRHFINIDEQSWVRDHHFFGLDVYPAAGMLVMALEGAKQIADTERVVSAYRFQRVTVGQALIVPSNSANVETQLTLKLRDQMSRSSPQWYSFRIAVCSDGRWSECCNGEVGIEYEQPLHEVENQSIAQILLDTCREAHNKAWANVSKSMSSESLYDILEGRAVVYGPSFQALEDIHHSSDKEAVAWVNTLKWKEGLEESDFSPHVIHPATLDSIIHLSFAAMFRDGDSNLNMMVPNRIHSLRISAKPVRTLSNHRLSTLVQIQTSGLRSANASFSALQSNDEELVVMGEVEFTGVEDSNSTAAGPLDVCYHIDWKPDIDLMSPTEINSYCHVTPSAAEYKSCQRDQGIVQDIILQALYHSAKHLERSHGLRHDMSYLENYVSFIRRKLALHVSDFHPCESLDRYLNNVADSVGDWEEAKLAIKIARKLSGILDGSQDPLAVLFEDDSVTRMYAEGSNLPTFTKAVAQYTDAIAHKKPSMKVLEVGAGTGAFSDGIIDVLGQNGDSAGTGARFSQYVYTDLSPSFFESAKERLAKYSDRMEFKVLDIEKEPGPQGFTAGDFDVVIVMNVLHATSNLAKTLKHIHQLLRPGGKLIIGEIIDPDCLRVTFVYGLLPGWWLSTEQERKVSPLLTEDQWRTTLTENGFASLEVAVTNNATESDTSYGFMVTSKPVNDKTSGPDTKLVIISSRTSTIQREVAAQLELYSMQIGSASCLDIDVDDDNWPDLKQHLCIFLADIDGVLFQGLSETSFSKLKLLLADTTGIIWVSGSDGSDTDALAGAATGFSRSYRSENTNCRFVSLTLDSTRGSGSISNSILKVLEHTLLNPLPDNNEDEYREVDGHLHVGRLIQARAIDKQISSHYWVEVEPRPFRDPVANGRYTKLSIETPGLLETMRFVASDALDRPLGEEEIEVEVKAVGLNFRDILIAIGQLSLDSFGSECAGIIKRKGAKVQHLDVGDRVACVMMGAFATIGRCLATVAAKIPGNMSFATAAALPIISSTAVYALFDVGRLRTGETILIHSGAGGFGQVAIQLAQSRGAVVYTTVGTLDKKEFLHAQYNIPYENILSSRTLSFGPALMRLTGGRGVDVVLNTLGGEALRESWKCMAPHGRFLEAGKKDAKIFTQLPMETFAQNVTFAMVDMSVVMTLREDLLGESLRQALDLTEKGVLRTPSPLHVFPGSEVEKAFRLLQSGKSIGKIVVEFNDNDLVPTVPSNEPTWSFDPDASYVIAGGLGGIGRSVAPWMADRGARNIILLSRRQIGEYDEKIVTLLAKLRQSGVSVATPPCDIADEPSLLSALESCKNMPPIKGCIQASMVLRDNSIAAMTLQQLQEPQRPKVQGSLNLHRHLPGDLDFFVMLSSVAGVTGWTGQAAYAAGNVFQDRLAAHRVARGLKAVCIDFGIVYDVGFVAENAIRDSMQAVELLGIGEKEIHCALEYYCDPRLPIQTATNGQVIIGFENLAQYRIRGGEEGPWFSRPLFACSNQIVGSGSGKGESATGNGSGAGGGTLDVRAALKDVKTVAEAADVITEGIASKLAVVLGTNRDEIDTDRPFHTYGIDSLVALEIRNWFRKAVSVDMAVFEILSNANIADICASAAAKSPMLASLTKIGND